MARVQQMIETATLVLLVFAFILAATNAVSLSSLGITVATSTSTTSVVTQGTPTAAGSPQAAFASLDVTPKGVPAVYGAELGISFDDVSPSNQDKANATINKLAVIDQSVTLSGDDLKRYILITNSISCEYCCGVPAITDAEGNPACGCAHSYAMRGVAKYLIKNHGAEYSDLAILEELGKWKTLFFPDNVGQKAALFKANDIELNYINLASNKYRGAEQQAASSTSATSSSAPQVAGGC